MTQSHKRVRNVQAVVVKQHCEARNGRHSAAKQRRHYRPEYVDDVTRGMVQHRATAEPTQNATIPQLFGISTKMCAQIRLYICVHVRMSVCVFV